jgi:hypothetical protein
MKTSTDQNSIQRLLILTGINYTILHLIKSQLLCDGKFKKIQPHPCTSLKISHSKIFACTRGYFIKEMKNIWKIINHV